MKTSRTRSFAVFAALAALLAAALPLQAKEPTAFDLIKEGNRHVGEDAKDKIVQIRSEKSIGSLQPNIWYVVFYDEDATFDATEVKFVAGRKVDVNRPTRLLEPISGGNKQLDRSKIKLDSDKAIEIAVKEPILNNIKVTSTQLTLTKYHDQPAWKVRLWASKLRDEKKEVKIGELILSAEDGKVLKNDLNIKKVD
jgi:hypothetical protein